MEFTKMHGLGNDFVMLDCLKAAPPPDARLEQLSNAVCDRHFGVGADGLILVLRESPTSYRMRMFNPDGSESEMCGNGIRCFARFLFDRGLIGHGQVAVATMVGVQQVEVLDRPGSFQVRVDMGTPRLLRSQIPMLPVENNGGDTQVVDWPLEVGDQTFDITAVNVGNPHCIIFVDDVESVALKELGLAIEHHEQFPARTNVHFVQVLGPHRLWMRSWERGAGDTLACGSGACAVTVAAALRGAIPPGQRQALVQLPGGDLQVEWTANNHIFMTGPAETVFEGELDPDFLSRAHPTA